MLHSFYIAEHSAVDNALAQIVVDAIDIGFKADISRFQIELKITENLAVVEIHQINRHLAVFFARYWREDCRIKAYALFFVERHQTVPRA